MLFGLQGDFFTVTPQMATGQNWKQARAAPSYQGSIKMYANCVPKHCEAYSLKGYPIFINLKTHDFVSKITTCAFSAYYYIIQNDMFTMKRLSRETTLCLD